MFEVWKNRVNFSRHVPGNKNYFKWQTHPLQILSNPCIFPRAKSEQSLPYETFQSVTNSNKVAFEQNRMQ